MRSTDVLLRQIGQRRAVDIARRRRRRSRRRRRTFLALRRSNATVVLVVCVVIIVGGVRFALLLLELDLFVEQHS